MANYIFVSDYLLDVKGNLHLLGKLNGVRVPEDLILGNSTLIDRLQVTGDVIVEGQLITNGYLNNVPLAPLFNFTLNEDSNWKANLRIIGGRII